MNPSSPKKKTFKFSLLQKIFFFVKPYNSFFRISLVLALVMAFFAPIRPYLIQLTIDKVTKPNIQLPEWLNTLFFHADVHLPVRFILYVTIFQIIFIIVESAIRFSFTFLTSWLGQNVVKDLRVAVFKKIIALPLKHFDTTPIGTLTTRTINDI